VFAIATRISPEQRSARTWSHGLQDELVYIAGAGEDVFSVLEDVGALLLRRGIVAGVEWRTKQVDGSSFHVELAAGDRTGPRATVSLGRVGRLVLYGHSAGDLVATLGILRPLLRLRSRGDQLAAHASRLARRTEALDDVAGLVAHDVRSSLIAALRDEDPREGLTRALDLVDSILEAARADLGSSRIADIASCTQLAIADLGDPRSVIVSSAGGEFPMPSDALRLVLRNLLANAVAAGAKRVHVSLLARGGGRRMLVVDDDGVGLTSADLYATGSQLGLRLCRRLVERCGGALELRPRAIRGTRAVIIAKKGEP
jgi:signal transduction histidine kinase